MADDPKEGQEPLEPESGARAERGEQPQSKLRYKEGNTAADGSYVVGKCQPPESGKFRKDDGRERGRRRKGTKNLETDFNDVLHATSNVSVNGTTKKMSKQRGIVLKLVESAGKGQIRAIEYTLNKKEQFDERARQRASRSVGQDDEAIVEAFLVRRLFELSGEPLGDSAPLPSTASDDDMSGGDDAESE